MKQTKKQDFEIKIFAVFMTDIEKALCLKLNIDPLMLLLEHYYHKLKLFQPSETEKLSPLQSPDIDHRIELKQINSQDLKAL